MVKDNGHVVDLSLPDEISISKSLKEFCPEIVAFSVTSGEHTLYLDCIQSIARLYPHKENRPYIIMGGMYPIIFSEIIENNENIDAICIGEGEEKFIELLEKFESGKNYSLTENFWFRQGKEIVKNAIVSTPLDINKLPIPDRDLFFSKSEPMRNALQKTFLFSRGCLYSCTFCHNVYMKKVYKKGFYRNLTPEKAVQEITDTVRKYKTRVLYFYDDNFHYGIEWLESFKTLYKKEVNLPFSCHLRLDKFLTRDAVSLLKEAGCYKVLSGIEAGNQTIRRKTLKRHETNDVLLEKMQLLKDFNIYSLATNIFGIPNTTFENDLETLDFNLSLKPDYALSGQFMPLPKLKLTEDAYEQGLLSESTDTNEFNIMSEYSPLNINYKKELYRLTNLSSIIIKFPFLRPLLPFLLSLPLDKLYFVANKYFRFLSEYLSLPRGTIQAKDFLKIFSHLIFKGFTGYRKS
ncbi:MAG: B12-binding domain-containing radical SAM protein [Nitrospinae bacterium]|nr:B12-binding domain-containing radical SAM protein [Nitrospinota bacterium]